MIQNEIQLQQTRDAVASLERSLAILQRDRPSLHPDRYALMARCVGIRQKNGGEK